MGAPSLPAEAGAPEVSPLVSPPYASFENDLLIVFGNGRLPRAKDLQWSKRKRHKAVR